MDSDFVFLLGPVEGKALDDLADAVYSFLDVYENETDDDRKVVEEARALRGVLLYFLDKVS